ncbi:MAG: glycosyltransferase family 4 protein [Solirubrobacteraceae bacterium]
MRVALDSRPASDPSGVGRYSRCLLRALRETAAASDEVLGTNRPATTVRSRGTDVFHTPWMDGAMLHSPCPMVVTIHDLTALKRRSEHLRTSLRLRLRPLALQRASSVIVPTQAVAEDAIAHLRLERGRVVVIPEAADSSMYARKASEVGAVRSRFALPERYLVWVGGLQHPDPGTHIARLAATPHELPLVLVGPTRPWAHELPEVILTGNVSDDELAAIYTGAHALLISTEGEGFGLPAVEALACGAPVVASEGPALREALGDRATFVAAGDMGALLDAAHRASRPAPPPPAWTWEDAARATWGVYARALAESGPAYTAQRGLLRSTSWQSGA